MSYIYVLKNSSYEPYVVKIGKTTLEPHIRSKQIYWGATGVPEHFEVAFICKVPDCHAAEKAIHKSLASYRKNKRREFFHLPMEAARNIVVSVSAELFGKENISVVVNEEGSKKSEVKKTEEEIQDEYEYQNSSKMPLNEFIRTLKSSPVNTSILTSEQKSRLCVIKDVFDTVFPQEASKYHENFSCDHHPDREIKIWEHMVKAFMKVSTSPFVSDEFKKEALFLLLMRSMKTTDDVLESWEENIISKKQAKLLLKAYELKPKPIRVSKKIQA
ncbi:GIY-YIG nuclease family protein [Vibrio coralliilyticus]|uniref:GIY-YIG nuclease family protein n=1 Tax=Vibrio coralliilyticus TaxID=190893 RepID=UPI0015600C37|nr:GIY-YIG nuclease family protein [Vibrio coralliilyticus]NRF25881.1 GIY-YIG nuclease family protein [Vibrio coralliilyticus]NRF79930.1 GIY-YIG nuclease family protein [Vibrio coralliilyticus]